MGVFHRGRFVLAGLSKLAARSKDIDFGGIDTASVDSSQHEVCVYP
ncbi:hypothetical protein ACPOL_5635 [Acidisarcina polymorpha]|uniref:Uncharacterized protein n=1 Tax=Acidisarcina polymorpha TaxID=2211140 RepID=A0A2Z5G6J5_9BACT|nr:hypothetical protein ACPOL_5635 [Acidisarcina polymorpha]